MIHNTLELALCGIGVTRVDRLVGEGCVEPRGADQVAPALDVARAAIGLDNIEIRTGLAERLERLGRQQGDPRRRVRRPRCIRNRAACLPQPAKHRGALRRPAVGGGDSAHQLTGEFAAAVEGAPQLAFDQPAAGTDTPAAEAPASRKKSFVSPALACAAMGSLVLALLIWRCLRILTMSKNLYAWGKRLQFRAEVFNVTNRINLGLPVADLNSPNFGRIFSAGPPRLMQFALKVIF